VMRLGVYVCLQLAIAGIRDKGERPGTSGRGPEEKRGEVLLNWTPHSGFSLAQ